MNIMQEIVIEQDDTTTLNPLIEQASETLNLTPQVTKNMEASALSALLVPGGQLPPISTSGINTRQLGKPTITKIPSPHVEQNKENVQEKSNEKTENLLPKEDNHLSGSSVDETIKLIDNSNFNWYFQHYNDSNLEPYVGIVYGSNSVSSVKVNHLSMFVYAYYLIRYFF
jgi:hypothetical protein